jgi:hypothetical protein
VFCTFCRYKNKGIATGTSDWEAFGRLDFHIASVDGADKSLHECFWDLLGYIASAISSSFPCGIMTQLGSIVEIGSRTQPPIKCV